MDSRSDFEAERAILEVHHGEVGALVAQNWRLPESIVMGVQYHHTPSEHPDPLCYAVSLADVIADQLLLDEAALGEDGRPGQVDGNVELDEREQQRLSEALTELGIGADAYQDVLQGTAKRFARTREQYLIEG